MMHKNWKLLHKPATVCLGCAGFAAGLLGSLPLCAIFTAASVSIYIVKVRTRRNSGSEAEAYGFVKAILASYSKSGSMRAALSDAYAVMPRGAEGIRKNMDRYGFGDPASFSCDPQGEMPDGFVADLSRIIDGAFSAGEDVRAELSNLAGRLRANIRARAGRAGQASNARFVSLLGIVLFFPLFAGISTGILASASQISGPGHLALSSVAAIFAAFIAMECFMHFRWEAGSSNAGRACSAVLCSSVGMLILKASSMFAISAI